MRQRLIAPRLFASAAAGVGGESFLRAPLLLVDLPIETAMDEAFVRALTSVATDVLATLPAHDLPARLALERCGGRVEASGHAAACLTSITCVRVSSPTKLRMRTRSDGIGGVLLGARRRTGMRRNRPANSERGAQGSAIRRDGGVRPLAGALSRPARTCASSARAFVPGSIAVRAALIRLAAHSWRCSHAPPKGSPRRDSLSICRWVSCRNRASCRPHGLPRTTRCSGDRGAAPDVGDRRRSSRSDRPMPDPAIPQDDEDQRGAGRKSPHASSMGTHARRGRRRRR